MTTPVTASTAPASKSGTAPPPVRQVANRPPRAPGMGPSKAGTPPPRPRKAPARPAAPRQPRPPQRRQQRRPRVQVTRNAPSDTQYQNVILAEFVVAILLVAATPLARKEKTNLSPYVASDVLQLVAITITYFLLALLSSASAGAARFSAWFGGLILLAVGLGEAAQLAGFIGMFGTTALGAAPGTSGTAAPVSQAPPPTGSGGSASLPEQVAFGAAGAGL